MVSAGNSAIFFNLDAQMAFLIMSRTFNLLFTTLVSTRLLTMRNQIKSLLGPEHALTYTSVTATLVESAAVYFVFDVLFVVTFSIHSNVENLILLENCLIQVRRTLVRLRRMKDTFDVYICAICRALPSYSLSSASRKETRSIPPSRRISRAQ
jgi:hypothetical protein